MNVSKKQRREEILKNKKLLIVIIIILVILVFLGIFKDKILRIIYPKTYKEVVSIYAEEYGVEENLIFAVIKAESNFNPQAISNRGAARAYAINGRNCKRCSKEKSNGYRYTKYKG